MARSAPLTHAEEAAQAVDFALAWLNRAIDKCTVDGGPGVARTHLYVAQTALSDAASCLPRDPRGESAFRLDGASLSPGEA